MERPIIKRIKEIKVKYSLVDLTFAKAIGVPQTTVSNIINRESDVKHSVLEKIIIAFKEISPTWLLTGEGNMTRNNEEAERGQPYYNIDFIGGYNMAKDKAIQPDYYINFSPFNLKEVLWLNITGHSMEPEISSGDIIAIKEVVDWEECLIFDEIYAIETTNDQRTIKVIKNKDKDHYALISINEKYEEQIINKKMISKIYRVLGSLKQF